MPRPKKKTVSVKITSNEENSIETGSKQSFTEYSPSEWDTPTSSFTSSFERSEPSKRTKRSGEVRNDLESKIKTVYVLHKGILKLGSLEDLSRESWAYRVYDTTGTVVVVNYDLNDAVPFVKTILNEVADFPEIRLLEGIRLLVLIIMAVLLLMVLPLTFFTLWTSHFDESIARIESKIDLKAGSVQKTQQPLQRILSGSVNIQ